VPDQPPAAVVEPPKLSSSGEFTVLHTFVDPTGHNQHISGCKGQSLWNNLVGREVTVRVLKSGFPTDRLWHGFQVEEDGFRELERDRFAHLHRGKRRLAALEQFAR
jgi:hypothetical protein